MVLNISNDADCLDVRDIIERFEELEAERDNFEFDEDANLAPDGPGYKNNAEAWSGENPDDAEEFKQLSLLLTELNGRGGDHQWKGDWYPVSLIRDSHFVEAMQDMISDIGDLPKDIPSYLAINWDATADNLRADYSSVDFDGVTYWFR